MKHTLQHYNGIIFMTLFFLCCIGISFPPYQEIGNISHHIISVQSLRLFATPWTAAR